MFWLLFAPFRWLRRLVFLFFLFIAVVAVVGVVAFQHTSGSASRLRLPSVQLGALFGNSSTHAPAPVGAAGGRMPGGDRADGVLLPAGPAGRHPGIVEPDRVLTPGASDPRVTQADIGSTICRAGYTATVRPPVAYTGAVKRRLMARGHVSGPAGAWELDHLVPLELAGDPGYTLDRAGLPVNLWLEPWDGPGGAHAKDVVEDSLHHAVCDHQVSLRAAQQAIGTDWYTALRHLHVAAIPGG